MEWINISGEKLMLISLGLCAINLLSIKIYDKLCNYIVKTSPELAYEQKLFDKRYFKDINETNITEKHLPLIYESNIDEFTKRRLIKSISD